MKLIPACAYAYLIALCMTVVGCTRESTRLAIQGSERSDQVRSFIIGQQHRTAKVLLFRDTLGRLNAATTDQEREAVLNDAWQNRDRLENWIVQDTLAWALHLVTVDAKLVSSRAMFEVFTRNLAKLAKPTVDEVDDTVNQPSENTTAVPLGLDTVVVDRET